MKISLNQVVSLLSDMAGKPFSITLQEELKFIFNIKRADWFQKIIDAHPEQRRNYLKSFSVPLIEVDAAECPIDLDCTVLRTSVPIPYPTRSSYTFFDYVGISDKGDGFAYMAPDQISLMIKWGSKYTSNRPKYYYENGYIYIYNEDVITDLNIRGLWPDQRQLNPFKCAGKPCYTDDDQYDVPDDIINTMLQDVFKNEMRLLMADDKAVVETGDETTK